MSDTQSLVTLAKALMRAQELRELSWQKDIKLFDGGRYTLSLHEASVEACKEFGLNTHAAWLVGACNTTLWNDVHQWAVGVVKEADPTPKDYHLVIKFSARPCDVHELVKKSHDDLERMVSSELLEGAIWQLQEVGDEEELEVVYNGLPVPSKSEDDCEVISVCLGVNPCLTLV